MIAKQAFVPSPSVSSAGTRKRLACRKRLNAVLRELGAKGTVSLLDELCTEQLAVHRERLATGRVSPLRRARYQRAVAYYQRWQGLLAAFANAVATLED